ncbi:hypothetical protein FKM82_018811 [Ascaphus truei]
MSLHVLCTSRAENLPTILFFFSFIKKLFHNHHKVFLTAYKHIRKCTVQKRMTVQQTSYRGPCITQEWCNVCTMCSKETNPVDLYGIWLMHSMVQTYCPTFALMRRPPVFHCICSLQISSCESKTILRNM